MYELSNLKISSLCPGAYVTIVSDSAHRLHQVLGILHAENDCCVIANVQSGFVQKRPQSALQFEALQCTGGYCLSSEEVISRDELLRRFPNSFS